MNTLHASKYCYFGNEEFVKAEQYIGPVMGRGKWGTCPGPFL